MDNLAILKADIANGLCTLIRTYSGGLGYVLYCNGLLMHVEFDKDKNTLLEFDVRDKDYGIEHFLEHYQDKYHFSHVMVTGETTVHFIYVKPVDMRPWMVKTIHTSLDDLVWCIHRQFEPNINKLNSFIKAVDLLEDTKFYTREVESETYTPITIYQLYSKAPAFEETNFFESSTAKS